MRIGLQAGIATLLLAAIVTPVHAQQPRVPPAPRITLDEAKRAVDAAETEARQHGWNLAFVIADAAGVPIYVRRMDGVPALNYEIALNKVRTVITSGMHTVDYAAAVQAGRIQPIEGALTYEGGLLLRRGGEIVGAFSASGASGAQDAETVRAGMAVVGIEP